MEFILIYVLFTAILGFIFKPNNSILGCGIFGFSLRENPSEEVVRIAMGKFKTLGLYNLTRGRDSCGVSIDDELIKGVHNLKNWDDFIENDPLPNPTKNFAVIGHTRSSTRGANTGENAHPFLINDRLIGVHNGVIQNIDDLLRKYEKNPADYKVDSQGLYQLLDDEGYNILDEYVGYAALAFKELSDPHTTYLYHGASKLTKHGDIYEERPMFWMETEEGIYYSSLDESLKAIRESKEDKIYKLTHNVIFQITHGEFTENQVKINREANNVSTTSGNAPRAPQCTTNTNNNSTGKNSSKVIPHIANRSTTGAGGTQLVEDTIMRESLPVRVVDGHVDNMVYFHHGRYWEFRRKMCHGIYHLADKGIISKEETPGSKPYYFYRGCMLKNEDAFKYITGLEKTTTSFVGGNNMNFAACMSRFSVYPVTNYGQEAERMESAFRNAWYQNDKRYNGSFTPKFSGRNYIVENGALKDIKSSQREQPLFNEFRASLMEIEVFKNGGVLGGASKAGDFHDRSEDGGVSSTPDLHSTSSKFLGSEDNPAYKKDGGDSESAEDESSDAAYFYELTFDSLEAAMQVIGNLEIEALRKYAKTYLEAEAPLDPDEKEIEMCVCDLIKAAINAGVPLMSLCDSEEDRYRMRNSYQRVLDANMEASFMQSIASRAIDNSMEKAIEREYSTDDYATEVNNTFLKELKEEEDVDSNIDIKEVLENTVASLEDINAEAASLTDDQDSDLSQEAAAIMFKGVISIQGDLAKLAEKYELPEISKKIKEINKKTV